MNIRLTSLQTRSLLGSAGFCRGNCLLFILALVISPLLAQNGTEPDPRLRKTIESINQRYLETLKSEDIEGHMALYAEDASAFLAGQKPLRGRSTIRRERESNLTEVILVRGAIHTDSVEVGGPLAITTGRFSYTLRRKDDPERIWTYSGHFLLVLKQQPNGEWLIHIDGGFPEPT